jgi:hypothetical protein
MPEWWSYSLSDFLLFSPRTYYRLIERYNVAVWPAQMVTLGLGLGVLGLLRVKKPWQSRIISGIVALLWTWVAWAFLWKRYSTINWAVVYLLPLFVLQVLLLIWSAIARDRLSFRVSANVPGVAGAGLLAFSVAVYPLLAPMLGRTWRQVEVFGIAPDPTAIGTAGLFLMMQGRSLTMYLVVPVLWCIISGLTLWTMDSPEALLPPVAALVAVAAAWSRRVGRSTANPPVAVNRERQ